MKDYLWVIIAGVFGLLAFILFIMTIGSSSSLIKRLNRSKAHIILNIFMLFIGLADLGIATFLILEVREQIEKFSML